MRTLLLALLAIVAPACGGARLPADARTTVLSLDHIDCGTCGDKLASDLSKQPGVYRASFDRRRAEVTLVAAPSVDPVATAERLKEEDFTILAGAGHGHYIEWRSAPEGADVKVVAQNGEDVVDLGPVLVKGKVTVVDFSALWCAPCRTLDEHMLGLVSKRADLAYRKLDVGDWDTPLARHYLKSVPNLPYVIVFGKAGERRETISGLDLPKLDHAIDEAAR